VPHWQRQQALSSLQVLREQGLEFGNNAEPAAVWSAPEAKRSPSGAQTSSRSPCPVHPSAAHQHSQSPSPSPPQQRSPVPHTTVPKAPQLLKSVLPPMRAELRAASQRHTGNIEQPPGCSSQSAPLLQQPSFWHAASSQRHAHTSPLPQRGSTCMQLAAREQQQARHEAERRWQGPSLSQVGLNGGNPAPPVRLRSSSPQVRFLSPLLARGLAACGRLLVIHVTEL
jgi:hypothetical protein